MSTQQYGQQCVFGNHLYQLLLFNSLFLTPLCNWQKKKGAFVGKLDFFLVHNGSNCLQLGQQRVGSGFLINSN